MRIPIKNKLPSCLIVELMKKGLSRYQVSIAELCCNYRKVHDKIFVSEDAFKYHLTQIYKATGLSNRIELLIWLLPQCEQSQDYPIQDKMPVLPRGRSGG